MSATSSQPFNKAKFAKETMVMDSNAASVDVYVHPALGKIEQVHPLMFLAGLCGGNFAAASDKLRKIIQKDVLFKKVRCDGCGRPFFLPP